jgi:hypothetical protein
VAAHHFLCLNECVFFLAFARYFLRSDDT